jgi:putative N6-adenine-specific DNA methylase
VNSEKRPSPSAEDGPAARPREAGLVLIATCALGLEELLAEELRGLGVAAVAPRRGAVSFKGGWRDVWRANWRLRTANRVLVELASWRAVDEDALASGAGGVVKSTRSWAGLTAGVLFHPNATLALRSSSRRNDMTDTRWVSLRTKDGIVDAQRQRFGRRSSIEKQDPDRPLRLLLDGDRATLLLDTSGTPLDRRGYRLDRGVAPLRENLAAACILASGWDGTGPVVDPMCGSGTLLAEAAAFALGLPAGRTRDRWAFQRLPNFDSSQFAAICREPLPAPGSDVELVGIDMSRAALAAARSNVNRAGVGDRVRLERHDAFGWDPPPGPGLLVINPPYGERMSDAPEQWKEIGDMMKQRYAGYRAVVIAVDAAKGKYIGLRPSFRLPVRNGPIEARILGFELYRSTRS